MVKVVVVDHMKFNADQTSVFRRDASLQGKNSVAAAQISESVIKFGNQTFCGDFTKPQPSESD